MNYIFIQLYLENSSEKVTMSASFFPSLKHMVLAKLAIAICKDPEVGHYINHLDFLWHKRGRGEIWKELMDSAEEKICELPLPPKLHQSILAVIKPIALEMARWKADHINILGGGFDFQGCYLFWKLEGIIDRQKTAEILIRNKNIRILHRFFLACCYCNLDEIEKIYDSMCSKSINVICNSYFSDIVSIWLSWLRSKGDFDWSELVEHLLSPFYPTTICNYQRNMLWLRSFFGKLTTEQKKICILHTVNDTFKDHDNFRFCLSQLNAKQRESVFKERPLRLLRFLLDWPYQSLFFEAAEQMWKYLQVEDFRYLLYFIIYIRITTDWHDFDYINLLKEVWHQSPKHFKDYIEKDAIFEPVKLLLSHDFMKLLPKEEIIKMSHLVELPKDKFSLLLEGDVL